MSGNAALGIADASGNNPNNICVAQKTSVSGTFSATGYSAAVRLYGDFNMVLGGTFTSTSTVVLERSFDEGVTYVTAGVDSMGTAASYTAAASVVGNEPETGVLYRLHCSAYTVSDAITYRLSQGKNRHGNEG